ncbi:hypothetical protein EscoHU1_131 [Escherichia phage EscoHU1]|uniref:DUF7369 domain-containing protein n=1 Tax=Escherichia phage EscoHU1 TaxID=2881221 RepID=A0AAD1KXJ3_9CAUD|nr:hypothetical protein EscoHU1_131 [Escherichia phage EscoHU1]
MEAQEVSNFADPNMIGSFEHPATYHHVMVAEPDVNNVVLKVDREGNVIQWDEKAFVELCSNSEDPTLRAMLAVFNLGVIAGSR